MFSTKYKALPIVLAALVIITAHTQVTLQQMAFRLSGVREGEVHQVMSLESYLNTSPRFDKRSLQIPRAADLNGLAVLHDGHATFLPGELRGTKIFLKATAVDVVDNTATHILVKVKNTSELDCSLKTSALYLAGFSKKTPLVRMALAVPSLNVTLSDCLLAILFAALLIGCFTRGRDAIWSGPTTPIIVAGMFIVVALVSLIPSLRILDGSMSVPKLRAGVIELLQCVEILIIGLWCFRRLFIDENTRRWFVALMVTMTAVVVFIGIAEYVAVFRGWTLRGLLDVQSIDSVFGFRFNASRAWSTGSESSRTVLALYLSITLPLILAVSLSSPKRWIKIGTSLIAVGSLCLILHAPLLVLTLIACLVVVYSFGSGRAMAIFSAAATLVMAMICLVNPHHGRILTDSIAYVRTADTYGLQPLPMKGESFEGMMAVQQKYLERQAAFNALSYSPAFGLGIGNYQSVINDFYENAKVPGHALVKEPVNLMERDSHSLFIVTMVETGVLGVVVLGVYLLFPLLRFGSFAQHGKRSGLIMVAIAASVGVLFLSSFFASFMTRGLQVIAIALLAYVWSVDRPENGDKSEETVS